MTFSRALKDILAFWMEHTIDPAGGFYGRLHADNRVEPGAPKGSVLNARILWTFSAAYRAEPRPEYLDTATRAFDYIRDHFIDRAYGGVYWTVDAAGQPLDSKKQVYALAFTIYGLTEYFAATGVREALEEALALYRVIENHSFDRTRGGYLEAFARDWSDLGDMRLSAKDANEKKTMNTHLHVLEAYTNLYRVWKNDGLRGQICRLINDFLHYMIDPRTHHLVLFLDEDWTPRSDTISFGHDIEASWLLLEAAEVIASDDAFLRRVALDMVDAACEGLAPDGSLYYEYEPAHDHWRREKHWWVQAEAMVGLVNAWQISKDEVYLDRFDRIWAYTVAHIIDQTGGEWVWGRHEDNRLMEGEDKAGLWKCPYHNSRALLEVIRRKSA